MNIIEICNLSKYYGKARGVIDLSLEIREGECFGFVGPNGAGKSTTIRTLLGLISPTSGSAKIFGLDCVADKDKILTKIGYMPSEAMFYNNFRVSEMIQFSAELHKKNCKEEAGLLCERLKLDTNKKIEELSLGNRKKVGIVCAMQHEPALYVFDEPTSGLDPLMQHVFYELCMERRAKGATIFLSSHILSEVQNHCDRAAIIKEGKLIACDTVENLGDTKARKVTVKGKGLDALHIQNAIVKSESEMTFFYRDSMQELISKLNEIEVLDLKIEEPDLEEIFMHYYQ